MKYKILNLDQGSKEWLDLRKNMITATDTAVILGLSPWKTPLGLWEEKLGLRKPSFENAKMIEGRRLEEEAREFFNKKFQKDYKPVVLQSSEHDFMMASLDGMDQTGSILEIKCGIKSFEQLKDGIIPEYYKAQMQKQMYVAGTDSCTYLCYRSEKEYVSTVFLIDNVFIKKMIQEESLFYKHMIDFTAPNSLEKDYVIQDSKEWRINAAVWREKKEKIRELEIEEEILREELIRLAGGVSSKGYGIRLCKNIKKGSIDYSRIESLKNIDLEAYRKKSIEYYSLSIGD